MKPRRWNTASEAKVIKFVEINPGLTASMIAILWRRPYGTMSSILYRLASAGKINRFEAPGMRGQPGTWRYHQTHQSIAKAAVKAVLERNG